MPMRFKEGDNWYNIYFWNKYMEHSQRHGQMYAASPEQAVSRYLYINSWLRSSAEEVKAVLAIKEGKHTFKNLEEAETPEEAKRHKEAYDEWQRSRRFLTTEQIARFFAFRARIDDEVDHPKNASKYRMEIERETEKAYYATLMDSKVGGLCYDSYWVAKSIIAIVQYYDGD